MKSNNKTGHLAALFTILIWGTTYISTKVLLVDFRPVEILVIRFIMGYLALFIACPHLLRTKNWKQEATLIGAGLCGICLYYLLENIALTCTLASNVGVIISVAPFFTGILSFLILKGSEKPRPQFFIGFVVAMAGIACISLAGSALKMNPIGDLLALLAAVVWALYSILTKKIGEYGYSTILVTRRTFFYGIIFMIPTLFLMDFHPQLANIIRPVNLCNLLFLGLGASALCFVTWNYAVKMLGAIKSSVYIYAVPVITSVTSMLILHEKITPFACAGIVLTLAGLFLSQSKNNSSSEKNKI